tara:strand:- start:2807 stop:3349 length:543 start_codon:yes stop_codon:yes gene_type:complete
MSNYYYLIDKETNTDYNNMYFMIKIINDNKNNIIYKSSIPRLKNSKYRGIQAFKQLLKHILLDNDIKFNENSKELYIRCFKLVFNFECFAMNINNKKTLLFNTKYKKEKIEELIKFEKEYFGPKVPEHQKINKKDIINICKTFIINYELEKEDIIELFVQLLNINHTNICEGSIPCSIVK